MSLSNTESPDSSSSNTESPDSSSSNTESPDSSLLTPEAIAGLGLRGRDFLREADFTSAELDSLIKLADALASAKRSGNEPQLLPHKNIALIFEKTSTRTRCAFEVAAYDQGGHVTYIDPVSSQIGHKESIEDTAQVLSRFYDGIEFRGSAHSVVEELAKAASVPVFNGLTDEWHPTQMLADFLTMANSRGSFDWSTLSYAYLGDARNNVGNSLLVMGALMGCDVRIAAPQFLQPVDEVQQIARELAAISGARITITSDAADAVNGVQFIHTDVWVSMGEPEAAWIERIDALRPYRITPELMAASGNPLTKFMHCLPAYHDQSTKVGRDASALAPDLTDGIEVTDSVFRGNASIVFDQAENRLHTIKALMVATLI